MKADRIRNLLIACFFATLSVADVQAMDDTDIHELLNSLPGGENISAQLIDGIVTLTGT